jgi:hypothetical protein
VGQYHKTVNLDKREYLNPHQLGNGLKLVEQGGEFSVQQALHILLPVSNGRGGGDYAESPIVGRWGGDRIAIVGDYAKDDDLHPDDNARHIFDLCQEPEDLAYTIRILEEQLVEGKVYGQTEEEAMDDIEFLRRAKPFTNITLEVREYIQEHLAKYDNLVYVGDQGWGRWEEAS